MFIRTAAVALALTWATLPARGEVVPIGAKERFSSYGANYFLLANRMQNNGWADHDERAIRAHYSLRYVLYGYTEDCAKSRTGCDEFEAFVDYTGEFDFYWNLSDTRASGPVINRLSNPGGHVRWRPPVFSRGNQSVGYMEVGYEHESNGQVTEVATQRERESAQRAYADRDRPFFDGISRGSNFFALAMHRDDLGASLPISVTARLRLYTFQDNDVTWGPLAGSGVRLSDYQRLAVHLGYGWDRLVRLDAHWTVGDKGLKTDSFDLGCTLLIDIGYWNVPLYLRYHRGPLNTLSNYTQRQDSLGIGLRLAAF